MKTDANEREGLEGLLPMGFTRELVDGGSQRRRRRTVLSSVLRQLDVVHWDEFSGRQGNGVELQRISRRWRLLARLPRQQGTMMGLSGRRRGLFI
jgi:hypothetical protein